MVGKRRLRDAEGLQDPAGAGLSARQHLEYLQAVPVGQRLEHFRVHIALTEGFLRTDTFAGTDVRRRHRRLPALFLPIFESLCLSEGGTRVCFCFSLSPGTCSDHTLRPSMSFPVQYMRVETVDGVSLGGRP